MPVTMNSSIHSYLINMMYANSKVNRVLNRKLFATDYNNVTSQSLNANLSAANFKEQQTQYKSQISGFHQAMTNLKTSAQSLVGANNVFNAKNVTDVQHAVTGTANAKAQNTAYDVSVQQLAQSQRNVSKSLDGNAKGALSAGFYVFDVKSGAKQKQLAVTIAAGDDNKQALNKVADAINQSDTGLTAEVKNSNNKVYLSIEGQSGAEHAFALQDVSNNLVSSLQLSSQEQTSQDALYTVDGENKSSAANTVMLDNGKVTLNFHKVTSGTDRITVTGDLTKQLSTVENLVADYNEINYNIANADNVTKKGQMLLSRIQNQFSGSLKSQLSEIGLTMDSKTGNISVDQTKLTNALSHNADKVERLLGRGLAPTAQTVATAALDTAAASYFKSPSVSDYLNYGYNIPVGNTHFYNYSQGLFLDMTV